MYRSEPIDYWGSSFSVIDNFRPELSAIRRLSKIAYTSPEELRLSRDREQRHEALSDPSFSDAQFPLGRTAKYLFVVHAYAQMFKDKSIGDLPHMADLAPGINDMLPQSQEMCLSVRMIDLHLQRSWSLAERLQYTMYYMASREFARWCKREKIKI